MAHAQVGGECRQPHIYALDNTHRLPDGPAYADSGKPSKRTLLIAMEAMGAGREETAMLGDKLLTDVLGAKRSNVLALMVEPLGGPVGAWNHVLHLLQRPFKFISKRRFRK